MSKLFRVVIFEADNRLVGFDFPTIHNLVKYPSVGAVDYLDKFLYGSGTTGKRLRKKPSNAVPLQGPVLAANLLNKKYNGNSVEATVYIPGISEEANTLTGVRDIIKHSNIVVVSSNSVNTWAQKEIIRIAVEEGKKTIAAGVHVLMYESARSLLEKGTEDNPIKIPASRHMDYNDSLVVFPGADYIIQHNQYNVFLNLVELIGQDADSPDTVKSIRGVGYRDSGGNIRGLTERVSDMIVPEIPDVIYDPRVIHGYDKKLKLIALTGSEQGCINSCQFCQIKKFMGGKFIYNPPFRLYDNLKALFDAGLLKGKFNPLWGALDKSVFFTDDSPVLGGPLEEDIPFDYVEFSKIIDYISSLKLKNKRRKVAANASPIEIPEKVITYIQARNPTMLTRMKNLGISYTIGGEPVTQNVEPINLFGVSWREAVKSLQTVVTTRVDNPGLRPFAGKDVQYADPVENMGHQLRKNYIEFSKMLDEIEQFEQDHKCRPSFSIQMSVRAVTYLQAQNPFAMRRMHDLGFDMMAVGFEDIINKDTKGIAGVVKSKDEESKETINLLKQAGLVIFGLLICSAEIYQLGEARKTAEKALEMGINCVQIFSVQPHDGTRFMEKSIQRGRCLFQVAGHDFDAAWRNLEYGLRKGEVVTTRPDNASMLGLQLDILDAALYFNKFSHHLPLFKKEFRKKGWRTAIYGLGLPTMEVAAMARDLEKWLFHTPIREGKNYIQILSQIDPRWKKEEYTLTLVRKFGLEEMLNVGAGSEDYPR